MRPREPVYIVGGGHSTFLGKGHPEIIHPKHPEFGQRKNPGLEAHVSLALDRTYQATGVDPRLMDKVYVSNFLGEPFLKQGHLGSLLVAIEQGL